MQPRRFVLVGTRVEGTGAAALAQAAAHAGVDVRATARRPPGAPWRAPGWHRLVDHQTQPGLGGLLGSWVSRAVRGAAAQLAEQLLADPWLAEQVGGRGDGPPEVLVVALDDTAAQALARWRAESGVVDGQGRPVSVLTWDQGAEALAEETAAARAAGAGVDGEAGGALTEGGPGAGEGRGPARPLGARHTITVVGGDEVGPDPQVRQALTRSRVVTTQVDLDQVPHPDLTGADVLILDGLGPGVLLPDRSPGARVVHLRRPTDRRSPWRHLLPEDRVDEVVPVEVVQALTEGDAGAADQVLAAALGETTVRLLRTAQDGGDEAALALAEQLLTEEETRPADGSPADGRSADEQPGLRPAVLRELSFLTKVTGSLSLERRLLQHRLGLPGQPTGPVREALERVEDRLRETEPGWLPGLPGLPVDDPRPGRVLHLLKVTLPQRQAGYSVRGHQSLRALVEAGVDVVAVAAPPVAPDRSEDRPHDRRTEVEEVVLDGVRYLLPPPVPGGRPTAYLEQQARVVLDVVREQRPAMLHVHSGGRGYDLGLVGAAVARASGLPWVYEVRGLFESLWTAHGARAERGETFERRMAKEAELVSTADAAVTLAETMRADLVARGVEAEHVTVVPNAVDPEGLAPQDRDETLARRWGTQGAFTFGYVSNLDHQREQIEDLVRAAVILRDLGLRVRALVVGEGTRRERLEELTRRLGAEDVVVFTGRVPHAEVAASYALLDVLVVPRSDERAARLVTPLKPYEAMAMGLPVVVSAQPALLEVIGGDERGWSYPAGDAPALARLLQQLAGDPARRAAVAARARDWVLQERTWAANARRYAALYRSVLPGEEDGTG